MDHDVSILVPEIWSRLSPEERNPDFLKAHGYLEKVEDFDYEYLKRVTGENKATYIPLERNLNAFQNKLGKKRVVVVKSQMGIVVGIYEGNTVAVSVPANLPKTTLVTIDGKALYIHRADYEVLDASLLR